MIVAPVFGIALLISAGLTAGDLPTAPLEPPALAARQKDQALAPLIHAATACIVREVTHHARYDEAMQPAELEDLITDAMEACAIAVRTMIDTHDAMYGKGSGEAFVLGPYLDAVPGAVGTQVRAPTD